VKLGLNVSNQYLRDESMAQRIDEVVEQVDLMRELGFDLFTVGQHHLAAPFQQPDSVALVAELPLLREAWIAETRERAWQEAAPYLARKYAVYTDWARTAPSHRTRPSTIRWRTWRKTASSSAHRTTCCGGAALCT